jgi:hypothetical protein
VLNNDSSPATRAACGPWPLFTSVQFSSRVRRMMGSRKAPVEQRTVCVGKVPWRLEMRSIDV